MHRTRWARVLLVATLASGCGLRDEMTTASSVALQTSPTADVSVPEPDYSYEPLPWATDDIPVATEDLGLPGIPEATSSPDSSPSIAPEPAESPAPEATPEVAPVPVVQPTPEPQPTVVPTPMPTPVPVATPAPVAPAPADLVFTTKRTWTSGLALFGTLRAHTELQVWNQSFFGNRQAIVSVSFTRKGAVVETREYPVTVPPADIRIYTFDSEEVADDVIISTRGLN